MIGDQEISRSTILLDREAPDPETLAVRNRILDVIVEIINQELTERQRFALVNVHFQGMSVVEVARRLDTTPNNVYKLVHDARKKLKRGLQRRHYTEADVSAIFG